MSRSVRSELLGQTFDSSTMELAMSVSTAATMSILAGTSATSKASTTDTLAVQPLVERPLASTMAPGKTTMDSTAMP